MQTNTMLFFTYRFGRTVHHWATAACLTFLFLLLLAPTGLSAKTIYVNNQGNDAWQGSRDRPVKTLRRAKEIVNNQWRNLPSNEVFEILLAGGQTFTRFQAQSNNLLRDFDLDRSTFAFVWDINRELRLSTYGDNAKATLVGHLNPSSGERPTNCIAVVQPSSKNVEIRNLRIERFEVGAIFIHETKNVTVRDNEISEIGTLYFRRDGQENDIYCAGVIYPRNSSDITVRDNHVKNCHNERRYKQELHGIYMTRLGDSDVFNNTVMNTSGSALKIRRKIRSQDGPNNIDIYNNRFYYTGIADQIPNVTQRGWLRLSGDSPDNCAYGITIRNSTFLYPFCDGGLENCTTSRARKCSVSNGEACGGNGCNTRIDWTNNTLTYPWARPSRFANAIVTLQAENRQGQNGTRIASRNSGYTGSGYVDFGGGGTHIEWRDVNGDGGGWREFLFRYANGGSTTRRCILNVSSLDGTSANSVDFGPTGGWDKWQTEIVRVRLPHGFNKIRLTVRSGSQGPDLDRLVIRDDNGSNSGPTSTTPVTDLVTEQFRMRRVYPNPFSRKLTLDFELTTASPVRLTLFDATGRRVAEQDGGTLPPGLQTLRWDGGQHPALPSGLYFYRLDTDEGQLQGRVYLRR